MTTLAPAIEQLSLDHSALGLFPEGYRDALSQGLTLILDRIRQRAEQAEPSSRGGRDV